MAPKNGTAPVNTTPSGRIQHMRKSFIKADGTPSRSATSDWTTLRFEVFGNEKIGGEGKDADQKKVVNVVDFHKASFSDAIIGAAAGHGLSQKIGDDLSGLVKDAEADDFVPDATMGYAEYVVSRLEAMRAVLEGENGAWLQEREGGAGTGGDLGILVEAIVRTYKDAGTEVSDEQKGTIAKTLQADAAKKKATKARPDVNAHYNTIVAERAAERARKAREAAGQAPVVENGGLDLI